MTPNVQEEPVNVLKQEGDHQFVSCGKQMFFLLLGCGEQAKKSVSEKSDKNIYDAVKKSNPATLAFRFF